MASLRALEWRHGPSRRRAIGKARPAPAPAPPGTREGPAPGRCRDGPLHSARSALRERNALSSHDLASQYFRRGGA